VQYEGVNIGNSVDRDDERWHAIPRRPPHPPPGYKGRPLDAAELSDLDDYLPVYGVRDSSVKSVTTSPAYSFTNSPAYSTQNSQLYSVEEQPVDSVRANSVYSVTEKSVNSVGASSVYSVTASPAYYANASPAYSVSANPEYTVKEVPVYTSPSSTTAPPSPKEQSRNIFPLKLLKFLWNFISALTIFPQLLKKRKTKCAFCFPLTIAGR
jgi:hypothetical protein